MSRRECRSSHRYFVTHPVKEQKHFEATLAAFSYAFIGMLLHLLTFTSGFHFGSQFRKMHIHPAIHKSLFYDRSLTQLTNALCNLLTNIVIKVFFFFTWSLLMLGACFMGDVHNSSRHYPVQYVIYVGGCLPCCQSSYIWKACADCQTTGWAFRKLAEISWSFHIENLNSK